MEFPKIDVVTAEVASDAVALGFFQAPAKAKSRSTQVQYGGTPDAQTEALTQRLNQAGHFQAKPDQVDVLRFVPFGAWANTLAVGLGSKEKADLEALRRVGASLYQAQKRARLDKLTVEFTSFLPGTEMEEADAAQALCEGYLLASYEFSEFKKPAKDPWKPRKLDVKGSKNPSLKPAVARAEVLARAVCFARELGDTPGNVLTPAELASRVAAMAKARKLKCTVFTKAQIEREKMGLLLGVGQGSENEPRFLVAEYRGGKKSDKPIALVGKGITFDTGGISIKPSAAMEEMKYDMMGAATVAGIFQAVSDLKLPVNVNMYIAAAENMPGGRAQKPGDIKRSSRGKTVEITNTDAEGRLILADALEYAQKAEPQAIFDFATLTGAVLIALGSVATGIMGTSPELVRRLKKSAEVTGEKVWELPLFEEYEEDLKSAYADIRNSGSRDAGSSKGGTFLKAFVEPGVPWVHCDIAGTAWARKDVNYHPSKNASGAMVRLMAHLLGRWSNL